MSNGTNVLESMMTREKQGVLAGFIFETIVRGSSDEQLNYLLGNKKEFRKKLVESFSLLIPEFQEEREDWQNFYKNYFAWDVDFSQVLIPQKPAEGLWRLLFVAKNLTCNLVYSKWTFKKWKVYEDIDASVTENARIPTEHYAVWVPDSVEPLPPYLGLSTKVADPNMKIGITYLEGMLDEAKYFNVHKKHLNIKGGTFCSGSRDSDGRVPSLCYGLVGFVCAGYNSVASVDSCWGIRPAVAL